MSPLFYIAILLVLLSSFNIMVIGMGIECTSTNNVESNFKYYLYVGLFLGIILLFISSYLMADNQTRKNIYKSVRKSSLSQTPPQE